MGANVSSSAAGEEPAEDGSSEYLSLLGFVNESWFRGWVVIEVILFAGGYGLSQFGTLEGSDAMAGQAPDVHLALGGVMGAVGVVFGVLLVLTVLVSVWLRLQNLVEPDVRF